MAFECLLAWTIADVATIAATIENNLLTPDPSCGRVSKCVEDISSMLIKQSGALTLRRLFKQLSGVNI